MDSLQIDRILKENKRLNDDIGKLQIENDWLNLKVFKLEQEKQLLYEKINKISEIIEDTKDEKI